MKDEMDLSMFRLIMLQTIFNIFTKVNIPSSFSSMSMDAYMMKEKLGWNKSTGFAAGEEEAFNLVKDVDVIEIKELFKNYYYFRKEIHFGRKDVLEKERLLLDLFSTIKSMERYPFGLVPDQNFPEFVDWVTKNSSLVEDLERANIVIWRRDFMENKFLEWNPEKIKIVKAMQEKGTVIKDLNGEFLVDVLRRIFLEILPVPWGQKPLEWGVIEEIIHCA